MLAFTCPRRGKCFCSIMRVRRCAAGVDILGPLACTSLPSPQKLLDRIVNALFVVDLRESQVFLLFKCFFELSVEFARAVRALDLAVTEKIALREKLVSQQA